VKSKWEMHPVPTIYTERALKRLSTLRTGGLTRKTPKQRIYQVDQLKVLKLGI